MLLKVNGNDARQPEPIPRPGAPEPEAISLTQFAALVEE